MSKKFDPSMYDKFNEKYGTKKEEQYVNSGSVIMDCILSDGKGVPLGTLIELSSDSGVGKSSILLHMCRVVCAMGKRVLYLDPESGVSDSQIEGFGLKQYLGDKFLYYPVCTFEDAEEVIQPALSDPDLIYIVIDSITSLIPAKLLDKSKKISDIEPGLHARYCAMFYQKYKPQARSAEVTMFFVNQTRTKLDFRRGGYVAAAGGSAQKFYMDIRVSLRQAKKLEKTEMTGAGSQVIPYGSENTIWTIKNRHARPFIPLNISVIFGRGISNSSAYKDYLMQEGTIKQGGGGYFTINFKDRDEEKIRGTAAVNEWVQTNMKEIREYITAQGGIKLIEPSEAE